MLPKVQWIRSITVPRYVHKMIVNICKFLMFLVHFQTIPLFDVALPSVCEFIFLIKSHEPLILTKRCQTICVAFVLYDMYSIIHCCLLSVMQMNFFHSLWRILKSNIRNRNSVISISWIRHDIISVLLSVRYKQWDNAIQFFSFFFFHFVCRSNFFSADIERVACCVPYSIVYIYHHTYGMCEMIMFKFFLPWSLKNHFSGEKGKFKYLTYIRQYILFTCA